MKRFLRTLVRRWLFWAVVALVAVYTLFGFLVAPRILKGQLVGQIADRLGRTARIADTDFNPWTLAARVEDFQLLDPDGEPFVAFQEFFVDFQVSSLFRRAYTFKIVRLVSPHTHVRFMQDEKLNYQDILARLRERPSEPKSEPAKPPRLLLQRLEIHDARLKATNLANPNPETLAFTPVALMLDDFTTIPNRDGTYNLQATGQGGGHWEWTGSLTFAPMRSVGTFVLAGEELRPLWEVVRRRVAWEVPSGVLGLRLAYAVSVRPDSVLLSIHDAAVALDRFALREQGQSIDLLGVDSLRVRGIELRYPEQTVSVERIGSSGVRGVAWRRASRQLNWESVLAPPVLAPSGRSVAADTSRAGAPARRSPAWKLHVGEVALDRCAVQFTDSTVTPPFAITAAPIDVVLRDVSSQAGSLFHLDAKATLGETGSMAINGKAGVQPLVADLEAHLRGLSLPLLQPYVATKAKVVVMTGDVGLDGRIALQAREAPLPPEFRFEGVVTSHDFLSHDARTNERLLAWQQLELRGTQLQPASVYIQTLQATAAYGRFIIFRDRHTNIADVLGIPPPDTTRALADAAAPASRPAPAPRMPIRIDVFTLEDGTADFADLSLLLPFAAGIEKLNGEVRGLSSDPLARASVVLDGGLLPTGIVQVRGEMNPLSGDLYTDLTADFRDYDMPALSPYTGQFLGRKVDQGKMQLALQYKVTQRELLGENRLIIDQLELGADVESPEATSLPVGLAVALLKDRHGKIDLDLPVKGNLDDPKFSIWDAVWDVLRNIMVKLVTAPFSLLGRLVGIGGDDETLSRVHFEPGVAGFTPAEQEKVTKLAQGLMERPQLRLEVRGSFNPSADGAAMREAKFVALADARSARDPKKYTPTLGGAGYSPVLFRDLYTETNGQPALDALAARHQVPKRDQEGNPHPQDTVLDEAAFYAAIRSELTAAQPLDAAELRALAQERSTAIKNILVQAGGVPEMRIFLLEVNESAELDDGLVRVELSLGS